MQVINLPDYARVWFCHPQIGVTTLVNDPLNGVKCVDMGLDALIKNVEILSADIVSALAKDPELIILLPAGATGNVISELKRLDIPFGCILPTSTEASQVEYLKRFKESNLMKRSLRGLPADNLNISFLLSNMESTFMACLESYRNKYKDAAFILELAPEHHLSDVFAHFHGIFTTSDLLLASNSDPINKIINYSCVETILKLKETE